MLSLPSKNDILSATRVLLGLVLWFFLVTPAVMMLGALIGLGQMTYLVVLPPYVFFVYPYLRARLWSKIARVTVFYILGLLFLLPIGGLGSFVLINILTSN